MNKPTDVIRRYLIFTAGLLISAFGVVFLTKASLGTSPIVAVPYALSLAFPRFSLGGWLILYQFVLIGIELFLLKREAKPFEIIVQIIVAFCFSSFTDFFMALMRFFAPEHYVSRILSLLIGCTILAFGVYLELTANVAMISYDAFVHVVTGKLKKSYGKVRTVSDISMVVIAAVIGLLGVREGTVIAALLVGNIVQFYITHLKGLSKILGC